MNEPRWHMAAGLLAAAVLLLGGLGRLDLWAPDEPRLAAVAEETRAFDHGAAGLVLLHLNGQPYTQKPPLYYWLAALAGAPLGHVDEWAARLPSALAGLGVVVLTFAFARRLGGPPALALLSAALLLTSFRFLYAARRAQLDVLLAFFELVALLGYYAASRPGPAPLDDRERRRWLVTGHAALGAAGLVKGPVGWLPLAVVAIHLLWEGRRDALRRLVALPGVALAIAPVALWVLGAAWLAPPGFLDEAVGENVFGRFFAGTSHARPFYYFAYQLPIDWLPWTVLLPAAAIAVARSGALGRRPSDLAEAGPEREDDLGRSEVRLLVCWIAAFVAFFSLSAGKRSLYLVPAYPALGILCAWGARRLAGTRGGVAMLRFALAATAALGAWIALDPPPLAGLWPIGFTPPRSFGWALLGVALALTTVELARRARASSAPGPGAAWLDSVRPIGIAVALSFAVELATIHTLLPRFDPAKSPRPIAEAAVLGTAHGEPIGVYAQRALEGGIGYYADRPVRSLPDADAVRQFVAGGGRVIVARERHWQRLSDPPDVTRRARLREGRRAILVLEVSPTSPRPGMAPRSTAPFR